MCSSHKSSHLSKLTANKKKNAVFDFVLTIAKEKRKTWQTPLALAPKSTQCPLPFPYDYMHIEVFCQDGSRKTEHKSLADGQMEMDVLAVGSNGNLLVVPNEPNRCQPWRSVLLVRKYAYNLLASLFCTLKVTKQAEESLADYLKYIVLDKDYLSSQFGLGCPSPVPLSIIARI